MSVNLICLDFGHLTPSRRTRRRQNIIHYVKCLLFIKMLNNYLNFSIKWKADTIVAIVSAKPSLKKCFSPRFHIRVIH